ncbi:MAG: phosphate acyltransferase [Rhodopseudomonas palustris]|nr:phosphate acyltransferase [Rhodopseudomonas palustris]
MELVREGKAEALMKGSLHTDELMGAVVRRDDRTAHRAADQPRASSWTCRAYDETLIVTDAAINICADARRTRSTSSRTPSTSRTRCAWPEPRVAILSAMETVNPKIPSTVEAARAVQDGRPRPDHRGDPRRTAGAGQRDQPRGGARSRRSTRRWPGAANILVVPDLEAGNMLAKNLTHIFAKADARRHRARGASPDRPDVAC